MPTENDFCNLGIVYRLLQVSNYKLYNELRFNDNRRCGNGIIYCYNSYKTNLITYHWYTQLITARPWLGLYLFDISL